MNLDLRLVETLRAGWTSLLDQFMPPSCMACDQRVQKALSFCHMCWVTLSPVRGTRCSCCSVPLSIAYQAEAVCFQCLQERPSFSSARSPYLYEGAARKAVLRFKNGKEAWAKALAKPMLQSAAAWDLERPLVVPVPLHIARLKQRGYNQALLLARALAQPLSAELAVEWLVRVKDTSSTKGLTRKQRQSNVVGAFRLSPKHVHKIGSRSIILVDDVMTTGATANACAKVLLRAGAKQVHVLTYARVAPTDSGTYLPENI